MLPVSLPVVLCVLGRAEIKHNRANLTSEIALVFHMLVLCTSNFRENKLNMLIKSRSLNNQHKSISFFYPQDNSLSWVWYIFSIYIFLLFYGTCGNMYNLLFLICALKFMQIAPLYLYHKKILLSVFSLNSLIFKSVYAGIHIWSISFWLLHHNQYI